MVPVVVVVAVVAVVAVVVLVTLENVCMITSPRACHLRKQLISERASLRRGQAQPRELSHPRPCLRRNEPHIILGTTPPLVSRK